MNASDKSQKVADSQQIDPTQEANIQEGNIQEINIQKVTIQEVNIATEIIDFLNLALKAELGAINQYFTHSKMCENWGWKGLAAKYRADSVEEMMDAEKLMDRILLLGGLPNPYNIGTIRIGNTVPEQLANDRLLELEAISRYREGIKLTLAHGDAGTREVLEPILASEEEHLDWIDTQLDMIKTIGVERYLQTQVLIEPIPGEPA